MAYDISQHPLRSRQVKRLTQPQLVAQVRIAETALTTEIRKQDLAPGTYTDQALETAKDALTRQVNRQVAEPDNPHLSSNAKGSRSQSFTAGAEHVPLDPIAVQIWRTLAEDAAPAATGGRWAIFKGHR